MQAKNAQKKEKKKYQLKHYVLWYLFSDILHVVLISIIRSDKGASEQVRRDIFEAAIAIASKQKAELYIHSYKSFLQLVPVRPGRLIVAVVLLFCRHRRCGQYSRAVNSRA